jgi:hypothetical protein
LKLTTQAKFNRHSGKPLVLLSPLDWGLGHTTRCIPVIQQFIHEGCEVIIACNSQQKTLLEAEFPHLTYHELEGYGIRYAKNRWITMSRILFQLPKMMIRVKREHRWLQEFLSANPVEAIISDNRFGLYSKEIPSVFITHQLAVKTGMGAWFDRRARALNYSRINRFTEVWIPDNGNGYSIAGELAKPDELPSPPVKYLGGISRFEACNAIDNAVEEGAELDGFLLEETVSRQIDLLIILSGPEPQRSIFEQMLLEQLPSFKGTVVLVRALPGKNNEGEKILPHVTSFHHLPAHALNRMVCKAALVISRSGYTTVMDLLKTKKKSILVPTPGQAEQEYLAIHLEKEKLACSFAQDRFNLQQAVQRAASFPFQTFDDDMQRYKAVISAFVQSILQGK